MDEIKISSNRSFGIVFFIVFLLIALYPLLKGNDLDINSTFEKDGSIKESIQKEATFRINFCKDRILKSNDSTN